MDERQITNRLIAIFLERNPNVPLGSEEIDEALVSFAAYMEAEELKELTVGELAEILVEGYPAQSLTSFIEQYVDATEPEYDHLWACAYELL